MREGGHCLGHIEDDVCPQRTTCRRFTERHTSRLLVNANMRYGQPTCYFYLDTAISDRFVIDGYREEIRQALRMICNDIVDDEQAVIDEDRYLYGWDVLHPHEIDVPDGKTVVKYRYLGTQRIAGPFGGMLYTNLPVATGQQFQWYFGMAEVVSAGKRRC